jgi:hypothetical protein
MYGLGLTLLATFAIAKGLWPIYVPGLVEITMLIMQITMKMVRPCSSCRWRNGVRIRWGLLHTTQAEIAPVALRCIRLRRLQLRSSV